MSFQFAMHANYTISLSRFVLPVFPKLMPGVSSLVCCLTLATLAIFCLDQRIIYKTLHKTMNPIPPKNGYAMISNAFDPEWVCWFGISSVDIQLLLIIPLTFKEVFEGNRGKSRSCYKGHNPQTQQNRVQGRGYRIENSNWTWSPIFTLFQPISSSSVSFVTTLPILYPTPPITQLCHRS